MTFSGLGWPFQTRVPALWLKTMSMRASRLPVKRSEENCAARIGGACAKTAS